MGRVLIVSLVLLFAAVHIVCVSSFPKTAPAFLWTRYRHGSNNGLKEVVDYRTLTSKDLAQSVLSEGGWSDILCSSGRQSEPVDIALLFVGKELHSADISKKRHGVRKLLELLEASFTGSNFSLALPFVAADHNKQTLENFLVSSFTDHCGNSRPNDITFFQSCALENKAFKRLAGPSAFNDFVKTRMNSRQNEHTDLIVFCDDVADYSEKSDTEGAILSELISSMEDTGAAYTILYASDPYIPLKFPYGTLERFLAESGTGNTSTNTTCDGVCQIKSSLLEGVFVGIVLLIILLSGLCCMMGIETPTRFETPQES
ncbi:uncharacterized protein LOC116257852 [Nymphaea colorata]|nr:uncharacterized protein LOC116257852 [Nymphaea colorata]XP_031490723.1 uncharacterized protein LOC116257852 [Nymphaea colorata]